MTKERRFHFDSQVTHFNLLIDDLNLSQARMTRGDPISTYTRSLSNTDNNIQTLLLLRKLPTYPEYHDSLFYSIPYLK